ncbi:MAG: hypothetical protein JW797_06440 [Bradymonadales bacterium]|nr:hypothetical protein [Bradymonadales bacterium]
MAPPIIYNLFPRLAGPMDRWKEHAERAAALGFTHLFLNPVSQPGFSGSLYAVREHDRVCTDFLPSGSSPDGMKELEQTLRGFRDLGQKPIMDLVINHTAIDSPLVAEHPRWFRRDPSGKVMNPSAIDPADSRKVTVWGDLAEIDNQDSPEREGLWAFWKALVLRSIDLGFAGFRCDAAYKVPAPLWRMLVEAARAVDPEVRFFAETLGCKLEEVAALRTAGLDYLFNSSKYWSFDAPWALEQHESFGRIAPSVSFPESHDTSRLMADTGGNLAVQRQRYFLAAVFSEGLLMPMGYEYGFTRRLNVVTTRPSDWEETGVDLTGFIRSVNLLKRETPLLGKEGHLLPLVAYDRPTLVLRKIEQEEALFILINKDWHQSQTIEIADHWAPAGSRLIRVTPEGRLVEEPTGERVEMGPAEIALVVEMASARQER